MVDDSSYPVLVEKPIMRDIAENENMWGNCGPTQSALWLRQLIIVQCGFFY